MLCHYSEQSSPGTRKECPLCPEGNCYIIQAGDTLYTISRFYNVSLDDLIDANPDVDPELIAQGQVICIPRAAPPVNCPTGATTYVVQKGDSFYSIAKKNKMHFTALLKSNPNMNPDALLVGQSICIPVLSSTYINETYGIKLTYPYRWSKINNESYAGIDGFFHVSAIYSDALLDEICRSEAHYKLKPYGTQPTIINTTVDNLEACFILPSSDQPNEMRGQAALIVKYDCTESNYKYLIIWTDKNHIKDIADSLEFLNG